MAGKNKIVLYYTVIGFLFGSMFPVVALVMDCCFFHDGEFKMAVISEMVDKNPIHLIILTAPIVLAVTFYFIGRLYAQQRALNANLENTNDLLNENNDLLDTFNYHISHDIKSTLNNQLGLGNMLLKYLKDSNYTKAQEINSMINKVSEDGLKMVNNFLDISKEGFNWNSDEDKESNIKVIAKRVTDALKLKSNLEVTFIKSEFDSLQVNESVVESILLNLFSNSIKYTKRIPKIEIQLLKENDKKIVIFKDNGIGIDLEKHGKSLFDPFYRVNANSSTEGTGVGLFIIKKLVQANMGTIEIESTVGVGTTFILTFNEKL